LLRLEAIDQSLDSLLLTLIRSGSLRLLRIAQRSGEITRSRFNAGLSQISVDSMGKPFGDLFENFHRLSTLFLILQLPTISIQLRSSGLFERLIPSLFRLIRAIQSFEDIRLRAEVIKPFLILN